jgi:putative endonuclease
LLLLTQDCARFVQAFVNYAKRDLFAGCGTDQNPVPSFVLNGSQGEGGPSHPRATARQAMGHPRMTYVYILRSLQYLDHYYVGITADLRSRLKRHNAGEVSHTSKYTPWEIKTYIAFADEK